jgi:hypothetical protein
MIPANTYRDKLVIQMRTSNPVSLAFGTDEPAIFLDGVQLRTAGSVIIITGALARESVYGVCDTGQTASGGYQEALGICD